MGDVIMNIKEAKKCFIPPKTETVPLNSSEEVMLNIFASAEATAGVRLNVQPDIAGVQGEEGR